MIEDGEIPLKAVWNNKHQDQLLQLQSKLEQEADETCCSVMSSEIFSVLFFRYLTMSAEEDKTLLDNPAEEEDSLSEELTCRQKFCRCLQFCKPEPCM